MTGNAKAVQAALADKGMEVITAPGGGFFVKDKGYMSLASARRITGIEAPKRESRGRVQAWGDWATVAMINRRG